MPTASDILATLQERSGMNMDAGNFGPVVMLDQDPTLVRLVACWRNVPTPAQPPGDLQVPEGLPEMHHLRWYWAMLEPDPIPQWIAVSGLPNAPHVQRAVFTAIDNRIVLPDGTISHWANEYLSRQVAARAQRVPR